MAELTLPRNLSTPSTAGEEHLPVDVQGVADYNPEQIDRLAKDLGHIQITGARLKALRDIGLSAEQLGVLRTLKGGIMVSADSALQTMGQLSKLIEEPGTKVKDRIEAAKALANMVNAMTRLATGSVKIDTDIAKTVIEVDRVKRNRFQPGITMKV
jgi:hypothetical protein